MPKIILVINPGSTSTKVALFEEDKEIVSESLMHTSEELSKFSDVHDQYLFRLERVKEFLAKNGKSLSDIDGIASRGGAIAPLEPGAYVIDDHFAELAKNNIKNPHPADLSIMISNELSKEGNIPAYAYDLVSGTGAPDPIFTLSGSPFITRNFFTHVLNSRASCFEQAKKDGTSIYENTYIVCHLGGGCSTNLIVNGKIVDLCLDDENGFSPERSGGLPCRKLVRLCFSGKYSEKEIQKMLKGNGGLMGYLGTADMREVLKMIDEGDEFAKTVFDAMVLQLAKDIGSMSTVVNGKVDKIILTGGVAFNERFTDAVEKRVKFIAPVSKMPGAFEMEALAKGITRVLNGEEEAKTYTGSGF